jgi:hypothetical protein
LRAKIKRNEDGTYSVSGAEGKIRAPLKDLLKSGVVTETELYNLIEKMRSNKNISLVELVIELL